ncbi:MAG: HYC_CC_PP family protein [Bacteroidota bacterium]
MSRNRRIAAFTLTLLTLVSSSSFSIGMHLCGGHLQDISVISEPAPCPMEQNLPPCHRNSINTCCKDISVVHDADEFNDGIRQIAFESPAPVPAMAPVLIAVITPVQVDFITPVVRDTGPPLPGDRFIRFRTILI